MSSFILKIDSDKIPDPIIYDGEVFLGEEKLRKYLSSIKKINGAAADAVVASLSEVNASTFAKLLTDKELVVEPRIYKLFVKPKYWQLIEKVIEYIKDFINFFKFWKKNQEAEKEEAKADEAKVEETTASEEEKKD